MMMVVLDDYIPLIDRDMEMDYQMQQMRVHLSPENL